MVLTYPLTIIELPTNSKMASAGTFRAMTQTLNLIPFTTMAKVKYYAKENTKLDTHSFNK